MPKFTHRGAYVLGALALFIALDGTSVAQTAMRAITGADVRDGSLTGRDVRNRSLTAADLAPGVLRAGPQGPAGAPGPAGAQGPAGERGERGPAGPDLAGATHVRVRGDRTPTENGEALRAAIASITDASATRPYVIQLAPGTYELGNSTLAMKSDVSIAGAGAATTRIAGDLGAPRWPGAALVHGANRTLLRDVTVTNRGTVTGFINTAMSVLRNTTMRIEGVVLETDNASHKADALLVGDGASVDVSNSRLKAVSAFDAHAVHVFNGSALRVRGSELVASGRWATGLMADDPGSTAVVENSAVGSNVQGITVNQAAVTVGASRVVGRSSGPVTCVASYDGGFAALNKSCGPL